LELMRRNLFCRSVWLGFKMFLYTFVCSRISGATFDPDNILVSVNNKVREYKPTGALVQTIPFNYGGREYSMGTEFLRGIVVDQYGWVDSYNGTFYPFMTRYSPDLDTFEHKTFPGWGSTNSVYGGGITAWQNFVFATNMNNSYDGGIVRFDLFNRTAQRFAAVRDFIDVSAGLDGKLYALASSQGDIYVYDPATLQQISHIPKPPSLAWMTSVAADSEGRIFVTGSDRTVSRLSSTGAIEATRSTGLTGFLTDVAVDEKGRVIVAQWQGNVVIGDVTLQNDFTSFLVDDYPHPITSLFVSFAHPVPAPIVPVPTPPPTPTPTPCPPPIHDILVSTGGYSTRDNALREFTPDGLLLRKIRFNYNGGSYPYTGAESLRDVVVDHNGVVNAFNGTFAPLLTRFQWECSAFSHFSFPEWDIESVSTNGGIGAYNDFIYVTDMRINGDASGIVRFDTLNNTATRFLSGTGFQFLTIGLDGKLYATPYAGGLNVYDPLSMQLLRSFPAIYRKVAVDQDGRIFTIDGYGTVSRFDNNGVFETSTATGFPHLTDIDIDETGRLIMTQDEGYVVLGDTSLRNFTWFRAVNDPNALTINAAFAPLAPSPALQLLSVVSEKEHGRAGIFDINLPLDGARAVECRSGGATGDYTVIFSFAQNLTQVGSVCSSIGAVSSSMIDSNDPRRFIVNLAGVPNAVYVIVTLNDVNGEGGTHSDTVSQEMGVLIGDSVGLEGAVNSSDISFVKSASGTPVTTSNFRADLNCDGVVNSADIAIVKGRSGSALPSYP
jgi:hypothetical protein